MLIKTRISTVGQGRLPMTRKKLYSAHVSIRICIYPELGLVKVRTITYERGIRFS